MIVFFETLHIGKEKSWHYICLLYCSCRWYLWSCRKQSAESLFKWFLDEWIASDQWLFLYDGKRLNKIHQTELFLNIKIVSRSQEQEMRLKSLWIDGNRKSRPVSFLYNSRSEKFRWIIGRHIQWIPILVKLQLQKIHNYT